MPRKRTPKVDLDARWKQIIERLVHHFLLYFLPELFHQTDWSKGVRSADKELQKLFPQASKEGRRYPDLLLEVPLLAGDSAFMIAHVEVEGSDHENMPERMFGYLNPLWNKYPGRIVALVIYTGKYVPEKFAVFVYDRFGTKIRYEYNTYLVRDQKEEELLKSDNPFALMILACLYSIQHAGKRKLRYLLECKKKLAELCFQRNYTSDELGELLTFVQWVIFLPKKEDDEYWENVYELINQRNMDNIPMVQIDKRGADHLMRIFYGKTSDEIDAMIHQAEAKAKAEAKAEAKAAEAKAKAELEALVRNYIWQLHLHGDRREDIARITQKSLSFVKKIIREMEKANVNGVVEN